MCVCLWHRVHGRRVTVKPWATWQPRERPHIASLLVCCQEGFGIPLIDKVCPCLSNYQWCVKLSSAPFWQDGLVLYSVSQTWQSTSQGLRVTLPTFPPWGRALFVHIDVDLLFLNGILGGAGCRPLLKAHVTEQSTCLIHTVTSNQTCDKILWMSIVCFASASICSICVTTYSLSFNDHRDRLTDLLLHSLV